MAVNGQPPKGTYSLGAVGLYFAAIVFRFAQVFVVEFTANVGVYLLRKDLPLVTVILLLPFVGSVCLGLGFKCSRWLAP
jgi:hypothetical protein